MNAAGNAAAAGLTDRMREVMSTVSSTSNLYHVNFRPGLTTYPIPFFGNICTAKVLTIGVNPSSNEFVGRNWPGKMDCESRTDRLLHYFDSPPGPHPWFKPWIDTLAELGIEYARGEAAHLDLSPRATVSMSSVPDLKVFLGMMSHDLHWFFEFLRECKAARLLMAAGTVTDRWYINEFLAVHARQHRMEITPRPQRSDRCALYEVALPDKRLPLFFSSVSPSDSERADVLGENVRNNRDQLRAHLN